MSAKKKLRYKTVSLNYEVVCLMSRTLSDEQYWYNAEYDRNIYFYYYYYYYVASLPIQCKYEISLILFYDFANVLAPMVGYLSSSYIGICVYCIHSMY